MLVQCLHRCPITYTTLCERHFYYIESGIQPNLQRQWVYYDVTGRGRQYTTTSQAAAECLPVFLSWPQMHSTLGHTKLILWMTDSQQKKIKRASKF